MSSNARQIDSLHKVLLHHERGEDDVPRVLRGVFLSRRVDERCLTHDGLELVGFDQEFDLSCEAAIGQLGSRERTTLVCV